MTSDRLRSVVLASSCAAFVAVPNIGALVGGGERTDRYDTVITPPPYAFAVWAPIFTACAADTVAQCTTAGRERASSRRTGWPLAAAYVANTAWSLAAQTDRFRHTPLLLLTATASAALAHRRLQRGRPSPSTSLATGMLLGWTVLASTVNLAAEAVRRGASPQSPATLTAAAIGLAAAGTGLASTVANTRNGRLAVAGTAGWGLLTISADRRRPRTIRAVAAAAVLALGILARRKAPQP